MVIFGFSISISYLLDIKNTPAFIQIKIIPNNQNSQKCILIEAYVFDYTNLFLFRWK